MQKVKILIVEDELLIAHSLKVMLEELGYEVTGIFTSGTEALKKFTSDSADIVIMDIHLADTTNGIDTSIAMNKISSVPVIFITNSQDIQLRKKAIYDANATYYISKPFTQFDVATAIEMALKTIKDSDLTMAAGDDAAYLLNDCIFIRNGYGFKKIMLSEIKFLKANGSYCELMVNGSRVMFSENLSYFGERLSFAKELVRIHRSYIVNVNHIQRVHENRIWVDNIEIPVGKTYRNDIRTLFRFI